MFNPYEEMIAYEALWLENQGNIRKITNLWKSTNKDLSELIHVDTDTRKSIELSLRKVNSFS